MNIRKLISLGLIIGAISVLSACGNAATNNANKNMDDTTTAASVNDETDDKVNAFLQGSSKVTIKSDYYNTINIGAGTYTLPELKKAMEDAEQADFLVNYAVVPCGDKSEPVLFLRFVNVEYGVSNFLFVIDLSEELVANSFYVDGYRTDSALYKNGYFRIGGSYSAAGYSSSTIRFDEKGIATTVCTQTTCGGWMAGDIFYDIYKVRGEEYTDSAKNMDRCSEFSLTISDFVIDDKVYFIADSFSQDSAIKEKEEAFVKEIESLGAIKLTSEEFSQKTKDYYFSEEELVQYINYSDANLYPYCGNNSNPLSVKEATKEDIDPLFNRVYTSDASKPNFYTITSNEAITDFCYASLEIVDMKDEKLSVNAESLFFVGGLGPHNDAVTIDIQFPGDLPTSGFVFTDALGNRRCYSVELSGFDGSLVINEVGLNIDSTLQNPATWN